MRVYLIVAQLVKHQARKRMVAKPASLCP